MPRIVIWKVLSVRYDVSNIEEQKRKLEKQQRQINQELETAGDIFQIHQISKEEIGVYMLDVCGHGVSAALVAVTISQFLMSLHNRVSSGLCGFARG